MQVAEPYQYGAGERTDPETFYIVASKIPRRDNGTDHLRTDTSHLVQLVTRIILQPVLMQWRQTTPSRFIPPLLGSTASDNPLNARQRCPIVVRTSFAKPHERVRVKSTALLSLPMARRMKCIDYFGLKHICRIYEVNAKSTYILRSVPVVLGYAERRRPPSPKKICLDRVHAPLKRQRVLQRVLTEGHAGLLGDTGQQVLDSLCLRRAGKWPSSHMGQHLRRFVVVRYSHPTKSLLVLRGVTRIDLNQTNNHHAQTNRFRPAGHHRLHHPRFCVIGYGLELELLLLPPAGRLRYAMRNDAAIGLREFVGIG